MLDVSAYLKGVTGKRSNCVTHLGECTHVKRSMNFSLWQHLTTKTRITIIIGKILLTMKVT